MFFITHATAVNMPAVINHPVSLLQGTLGTGASDNPVRFGKVGRQTVDHSNIKETRHYYSAVNETDTSKFVAIDTSFSYWNTMALNGYFTLHLDVRDHAGWAAADNKTYFISNPVIEYGDG